MTSFKRAATAALLAGGLAMGLAPGSAGGAFAGPASERIFAEGSLATLASGTSLIYAHSRSGSGGDERLRPIEDGEIALTIRNDAAGAPEAVLKLTSGGRLRELHPFPVSVGNPMLPTFLESSLRAMARMTGGSPFYIRNRMKDSLRNGGEIVAVSTEFAGQSAPGEEIVFRPFAGDKNRARMGEFADLELRFVMSDAAPGGFLRFSAATRPGPDGALAFSEEIKLIEIREGG